jgi:hypothetical protein
MDLACNISFALFCRYSGFYQVDAVRPGSVLQAERLSWNDTNVINLIGMHIICAHENILAIVVTFSRLR